MDIDTNDRAATAAVHTKNKSPRCRPLEAVYRTRRTATANHRTSGVARA
jgi:hypothetical protein